MDHFFNPIYGFNWSQNGIKNYNLSSDSRYLKNGYWRYSDPTVGYAELEDGFYNFYVNFNKKAKKKIIKGNDELNKKKWLGFVR